MVAFLKLFNLFEFIIESKLFFKLTTIVKKLGHFKILKFSLK